MILDTTQNTPGLGSNGEYQRERDGLFASLECHIQHKKDRLLVAFGPTVKTRYEPAEANRRVPSPTHDGKVLNAYIQSLEARIATLEAKLK